MKLPDKCSIMIHYCPKTNTMSEIPPSVDCRCTFNQCPWVYRGVAGGSRTAPTNAAICNIDIGLLCAVVAFVGATLVVARLW